MMKQPQCDQYVPVPDPGSEKKIEPAPESMKQQPQYDQCVDAPDPSSEQKCEPAQEKNVLKQQPQYDQDVTAKPGVQPACNRLPASMTQDVPRYDKKRQPACDPVW